ncbi:glycosyltransferase, group 1 family protein [Streptococcus cristatus ATCC 51100]|jgi:putative uncharacterized protein wchR|nr:glycosyltransferase [Streptococcus cristatus]EFX52430.1 glycosyltransferase, group 1 family protein [Streptococcus cristatus ATCC 51100]KJQ60527.1 putative teichuronic acid biosynthesis glycosyltransferase TuaH [Streptococcus cristatus]RSJ71972.1 putative teichuronic acid biosynthesis glycosyltransferase TuaH [Streptococcus cristatus]SQG33155.1 glycosyltransferase [Streptococcus cristatus ATCC 51100]
MKKILYVTNVDWNWIKQRPQFLAEGLSEFYEMLVIYRYWYNRKGLTLDNSSNITNLSRIYALPFVNRFPRIKQLNDKIVSWNIRRKVKSYDPDYIYITNPMQFEGVSSNSNIKVIYDCMDYHSAFIEDKVERRRLQYLENQLVQRADLVLVSSEKLKDNLLTDYDLYNQEEKIVIVRNGYNGKILKLSNSSKKTNKKYILTYVGTISHWFDFDVLLQSLKDFKNIEYNLIGPISKASIPEHDRIHYLGSVPHEEIYHMIEDADVLIMPFRLNDIVEAVDPVKLYEYINFGKNILTVRYKEISRFEAFSYMYSDYSEYKENLIKLIANNNLKYDELARKNFLKNNTWEKRAEIIHELIEQL